MRLYLPTALPPVCEIELSLSWQSTPAFTFAFGTQAVLKRRSGDFQIDTWADELVVQTSAKQDEFEHLMTLDGRSKSLRLRMLWNRETGRLAVYDGSFNLLAIINGTRDTFPGSGLLLENRGADLTVSLLRVAVWDGKKRPNENAGKERIGLLDGTEIYGKISKMDGPGVMLIEDGGSDGPKRVPLAQLAEVQVIGMPPAKIVDDLDDASNLRWYDGSRLHGTLLGVVDGVASIKTSFCEEPVKGALAGMKELSFPKGAAIAQAEAPFILAIGDHRLRGTLAAAGTALGWQPVGSADVVPLSPHGRARITRVDLPAPASSAGKPDELARFLDSLYLSNGDRIPCNVLAVDDVAVRIAPGVGESTSIPRGDLKAIELNTALTGPVSSFRDERWQIIQRQANAIEQTNERLMVRGRGDLSHPELMKDGGFEFDVDWNRNVAASLYCYLYTQGVARQASSPRVQLLSQNGQLQILLMVGGNTQVSMIALGNKDKSKIGFFTDNNELKIFVDGNQVVSSPLADGRPSGRGVVISCTTNSTAVNAPNHAANGQNAVLLGGMWGPGVNQVMMGGDMLVINNGQAVPNPADAPDQSKKDYLFALSNVRSGSSVGASRGMSLAAEDKKQFLLVPRSRQNNPPKQALVAQNGDLLRGELIALGRSVVQFRSAMDDVNIPRERLAAIVWLAAEDAARPPVPPAGLAQAVFRNGSIISLVVEKAVGNEIIGRHPLLGTCRLALDAIRELRLGEQEDVRQSLAYAEWTLINAKEPIIPGAGAGGDGGFGTFSPLLGKMADDFTLTSLDGKQFRLSEHQDKVVILDFWATWCNPCMRSLPETIEATSGFDAKDVLFVGVNQQETAPVIKDCMDSHQWNFAVAFDVDGKVGKQFQVDGIPQTFVIGKGGKIARVQLGYNPGAGPELKKAIESLVTVEADPPADGGGKDGTRPSANAAHAGDQQP